MIKGKNLGWIDHPMKTNSGFWQPCNSTCGCPILISDYTSNKHRYRNTIWCISHTYILCMNWYLLYPTNWLLLSVDNSLKRFWLSVICKNEDKFNFVELICLNERWKTESIQYFFTKYYSPHFLSSFLHKLQFCLILKIIQAIFTVIKNVNNR